MKKILLLVLSFIFLVPLTSAKTVDLNEIDLKLDFKDDWYVFTRYNLDNNSNLEELNVTKEYMQGFFEHNLAYIDAVPNDFNYELILRIGNEKNEINNLTNYNDEFVKGVAKELGNQTNSDKYDIYNNGTYKFATVEYYDSETKFNIVAYYTVVNNKGYTFQIQKEDAITDNDKAEFKEIVNTIKFNVNEEDSNKEKEELKKDNSSFNWNSVVIYTLIGAAAGGIGAAISKKKKLNK